AGHDDLGPYDFASVMHYSSYACAKGGTGPVIEAHDASKQDLMGSDELSEGDEAGLRAMYGATGAPYPTCGDRVCDETLGESCGSCPADCDCPGAYGECLTWSNYPTGQACTSDADCQASCGQGCRCEP